MDSAERKIAEEASADVKQTVRRDSFYIMFSCQLYPGGVHHFVDLVNSDKQRGFSAKPHGDGVVYLPIIANDAVKVFVGEIDIDQPRQPMIWRGGYIT